MSLKQKKEPQPFQVVSLCQAICYLSVYILLVHQQFAELLGQVVADIEGRRYTPNLTERKKSIQVERNAIAIKSKEYTNKYCTIFSL